MVLRQLKADYVKFKPDPVVASVNDAT